MAAARSLAAWTKPSAARVATTPSAAWAATTWSSVTV